MAQDVATLVSQLSSDNLDQQRSAAEQLMNSVEAASAAVELAVAAGSDDEILMENASGALEEIESITAEQAEKLAAMLAGSTQPAVGNTAYWAATLLGRLGDDSAPYVNQLVSAITASDEDFVRQRLIWAIGKIGPQAIAASEQLQQIAEGPDQRLAQVATRTLEKIRA